MAPPVDKLKDLMHAVIDGVNNEWPVGASALPDLQYVADGAVAWDGCEILAVALDRTFITAEGDITLEGFTSQSPLLALTVAVVDVFLLRCVPIFDDEHEPPDASEIETAADQILVDAQSLQNALLAAQKAGDLAGCSGLSIEGWTKAGPEGGMGGGVLRVRLSTL